MSRGLSGGEILFDFSLAFLTKEGHPAEQKVGPVGLDFFDEQRAFCRGEVVEELVLEELFGERLPEIPVLPEGYELG
jgi:hypothetical protein